MSGERRSARSTKGQNKRLLEDAIDDYIDVPIKSKAAVVKKADPSSAKKKVRVVEPVAAEPVVVVKKAEPTKKKEPEPAAAVEDDEDIRMLSQLIPAGYKYEEDEEEALEMLGDEEEDDHPTRRRMGRPPKKEDEKSKGWEPTPEELRNPSSPGNFLLWLKENKLNAMYASNMRRLLAGSAHPNSILDFLRDKDRSRLLILSKSKSPYTALIYSKSVQVAITPQTEQPWAPMKALSEEDRLYWNKQFVLATDDAITYSKERASEDLKVDLAGARSILATAMANLPTNWTKYSKAITLLSLYLNFWPLRDDCKGMKLAHSLTDCAEDPSHNYLIVPNDYLTNDNGWSIYIQKAKTVGPNKKYQPLQRSIPVEVNPAAQNEMPFVLFGNVLRNYIRLNNRNKPSDPERPFQVGDKDHPPFGVSNLSNFLTKNARLLQIVGKGESFVNVNRRMWDNYYYEHDRSFWPQVVLWEFHTARASRDSYMRGDSRLGCGCPDNPARPNAKAQERENAAAQAQAVLATKPVEKR